MSKSKHPMAIDHVIFDCDGVLIDSEWLACTAEAEVFSDLGVEMTPEYVRDTYVGMANEDMFAKFEADFGMPLPADFEERHFAKTMALFAQELRAIEGVEQVLSALGGIKSVASNSGTERLRSTLEMTALTVHFNGHIYSSDMVARPKPATDLFEHVLEQTGASAGRT
ncbi:MAG: HAD hydrolase-like protein, partial [Pseudomonadota bacterium]